MSNSQVIQNSNMNFDAWFEDFEAEISHRMESDQSIQALVTPSLRSMLSGWAVVQLDFILYPSVQLAAVQLGHDFVAGLLVGTANWLIYPLSSLKSIRGLLPPADKLPGLREVEIDLYEYLALIPDSVQAQVSLDDQVFTSVRLLSATANLLLVESSNLQPMAISLAAVRSIQISAVDNFGAI